MKKIIFLLLCFLVSACQEQGEPEREKQTSRTQTQTRTQTDSASFEPETPVECTSLISLSERSTKLNECSGPYYLDDVVFSILGRALVVDLSSADKLPGQKSLKHSTVLFHSSGVSNQDLLDAKALLNDWRKSRSTQNRISFYLTFWTGKKSELIVGELKNLIETLRQGFPSDKVPSGPRSPIHVELEP